MLPALTRPFGRAALRSVAVTAAALVAIPLGGVAFAADSAAAAPVPLSSTASTIAEVARPSIHSQTTAGTWLQGGSIDPTRDRLYLADDQKDDSPSLSVLSLEDGTASTIALDGETYALDAAVSPVGGTVYVVHNTTNGFVSVVDPEAAYTATSLPPIVAVGGNPQKVEVGADGRAYVVNLSGDTVSILGSADGADRLNVVQTLSSVVTAGATSAIDNDRNLLFIASEYAKIITVIDTAATPAAVVGTFPVTDAPTGIDVDPRTGAAVIVTSDTNTVSWFSSNDGWATAAIGRTEALGFVDADLLLPLSVDVRQDGTAMVVTQVFPSQTKSFVSVVPADTDDHVRTITVGNIAFWGVQDPREGGSFYVPNSGNGNVSVIADVTLNSTDSSVSFGQDAQARATLVRADGYPITASIAFADSANTPLGTVPVDASGAATLNLGAQSAGSLPFTATVATPATVALSAAGVASTSKASTSTSVAVTPAALVEGDSASVTVSVAGSHGTVPGGTVTLKNGATTVGSATLVDGSATLELADLVAGSSQLVATYSGDAAHDASVSDSVALTVTARTAGGVLSSVTAEVGGKLTINLTGFAPHETVDLTLYSDPIDLGSVVVDGVGSAAFTFTLPQVAPGKHTIVAVGASSGRTSSTELVVSAAAVPVTTPAQAPGNALATTGATGLTFGVAAGSLALLLGFALLIWRRSRRSIES